MSRLQDKTASPQSSKSNTPATPPRTRPAVAVAEGDGIGPEIMAAVLRILDKAGAQLDLKPIAIGKSVYEQGHASGIAPQTWQTLRDTRVLLKSPITTPQGGGYKSLNVTLRKTLGLYANLRPCVAYHPFVPTAHPGMNVVIVRENEEDTYAGIEHRQTQEVTQCLKLITRPGCERIVRFAFEYARRQRRKKVTCLTKDNIHKLTDGLFHKVFDEIKADYPELETNHLIIDIGAARLANRPDTFDVIVTPNLYGDIVSDIAAEITGSVGLAASANVGEGFAMFEAIHGSAPDIAGRDLANPSGLLLAAVMMLKHVGQPDIAEKVHNAWLRTIEEGVHTGDIFDHDASKQHVGTAAFADAVIERLGDKPVHLPVSRAAEGEATLPAPSASKPTHQKKQLTGVDVFIDWDESDRDPNVLGKMLEDLAGPDMKLKMITNRGVKVYPDGMPETFCTDHWRCRFLAADGQSPVSHQQVIGLLNRHDEAGLDFIKTEHLYTFDGERGYSLGQGE